MADFRAICLEYDLEKLTLFAVATSIGLLPYPVLCFNFLRFLGVVCIGLKTTFFVLSCITPAYFPRPIPVRVRVGFGLGLFVYLAAFLTFTEVVVKEPLLYVLTLFRKILEVLYRTPMK